MDSGSEAEMTAKVDSGLTRPVQIEMTARVDSGSGTGMTTGTKVEFMQGV